MENNCPIFEGACEKEDHSECKELLQYAKLVYCAEDRCLWYQSLDIKKYVKHHKDHQPFPADYYSGICCRSEIAINPKRISTLLVDHRLAICALRSDKEISGHLDFSKLPQGGNIPDPVDPSAAYKL